MKAYTLLLNKLSQPFILMSPIKSISLNGNASLCANIRLVLLELMLDTILGTCHILMDVQGGRISIQRQVLLLLIAWMTVGDNISVDFSVYFFRSL